ncbi:septum formation family protein [Actinophytocola oryzae]|uniref:Putative regulator of septum formation n=1 Tax=Actinophytocola oryzae TaxID=502181 RepID=A0A4R7UQX3_9PSEU|nr:septum formation family protein [Actinophytocola oryzae]TDV35438.1 putative regulator of septum formation [Actinophytocola oryzae]
MRDDGARGERSRAVAAAVRTALRDVGGPDLYRHNAFRLTGLPTDAGRQAVRQRQRQVLPALRMGADVDLGHGIPVTAEEVNQAFDRILEDPRRRLVDELFWLWGSVHGGCECTTKLHADHDAAVRAHCAVLDLEADPPLDDQLDDIERLWRESGRLWEQVLRRDGFWGHVRHRIAALDERQLDESVIDVLREQVPVTLLRPLVVLATRADEGDEGWLADEARRWPLPARIVDDELEGAVKPLYEEVESATTTARDHCLSDRPSRAGEIILEEVVPRLERLTALVPPARHRRTGTARDGAAIVLNNSAMALFDKRGLVSKSRVREWLATATTLASDPHTVSAVEDNRATLNQVLSVLEHTRTQVDQLVEVGRTEVARRMLRDLRRRLAGSTLAKDIDRMLAELGEVKPARAARTSYDPVPSQRNGYDRPYGGHPVRRRPVARFFRRLVAFAASAAAVFGLGALLWHWLSPSFQVQGVIIYGETVSQNVEVGTCIPEKNDVTGDLGNVPVVVCGAEHWGEVLGYVRLAATPSPYPGTDQAHRLAEYRCRELLARQGLSQRLYGVWHTSPDKDVWNDGGRRFENYATCVAHRLDNRPLPTRQLVHPGRAKLDVPVRMGVFDSDVRTNAPVGTCVKDKQSLDESAWDVPIVDCDQWHWAEILGYPQLYRPEDPWPGDATVYAAARTACQRLATTRALPVDFRVDVLYPGQEWWQEEIPNIYAACVAARTDDGTFKGGTS